MAIAYPTINAEPHHNDSDAMKEAITALRQEKIRFRRLTRYQLKIGSFSYYPATETITEDGQPEIKRRGLDVLLGLVRREPKVVAME